LSNNCHINKAAEETPGLAGRLQTEKVNTPAIQISSNDLTIENASAREHFEQPTVAASDLMRPATN
jgi:hypothetical protein